jgi:hypothetical protein
MAFNFGIVLLFHIPSLPNPLTFKVHGFKEFLGGQDIFALIIWLIKRLIFMNECLRGGLGRVADWGD